MFFGVIALYQLAAVTRARCRGVWATASIMGAEWIQTTWRRVLRAIPVLHCAVLTPLCLAKVSIRLPRWCQGGHYEQPTIAEDTYRHSMGSE